jgi:hypothetical protein
MSFSRINRSDARLTERDRATATLLAWLPLVGFLITTLPVPVYFLFRYFTVSEGAGEYMLFALASAFFSSLLGSFVALLLFLYRRAWARRLRERLASDGVTADELDWFKSELTAHERRTLKTMQRQHAALADAYRETLAARITASQVHRRVKRELRFVEKRLLRAGKLKTDDARALIEELRQDRARLQMIERESAAQRRAAETRLEQIEAAASRAAIDTFTMKSLDRLDMTLSEMPLALESARLVQEAQKQLKEDARPALAEKSNAD